MNQLNQIDDASIVLKANIYFDGRVISHTILQNGRKKTRRDTPGYLEPFRSRSPAATDQTKTGQSKTHQSN